MRHSYALTDETRKVIDGHFKEIAEEMNVVPQYIYGILYGDNPDPFSYFVAAYAACVRSGVDVSHWDSKLSEIKARYRQRPCLHEVMATKVTKEARTNAAVIEAIEDGIIDDRERTTILRAVAVERDVLDVVESSICGELRAFAQKAVTQGGYKKVANGRGK